MTSSLENLSILITDDDTFMQSLMERVLGTMGITQIGKADVTAMNAIGKNVRFAKRGLLIVFCSDPASGSSCR